MAEKIVGSPKWVKGEIGATLRRVTALVETYQKTKETAPLQDAAEALGEVRGVLLARQITLPARLVDEMQRLCDAMAEQQVPSPKEAAEAMVLALIQLPNHLDRLEAGADLPPLNLWPTINDLRESRGAPPLTPAELLVPGSLLAEEDGSLPPEALEALAVAVRRVRPHFHRALVEWYRPESSGDGLIKLERLFHQLHRHLSDGILADLFRLADAYAAGLRSGEVVGGSVAQALVGHLDRVFRPLVQRPPQWPDLDVRQLIDSFLIELAQAALQPPVMAELQSHFGRAAVRSRLPEASADVLGDLAAAMLGEMATQKERLDLFVRGGCDDRTLLDEIRASLRNLARAPDVAEARPWSARLRALADGFGELAMADAAEDIVRLEPLAAELLGIEAMLQAYVKHCAPPAGATGGGAPPEFFAISPREANATAEAGGRTAVTRIGGAGVHLAVGSAEALDIESADRWFETQTRDLDAAATDSQTDALPPIIDLPILAQPPRSRPTQNHRTDGDPAEVTGVEAASLLLSQGLLPDPSADTWGRDSEELEGDPWATGTDPVLTDSERIDFFDLPVDPAADADSFGDLAAGLSVRDLPELGPAHEPVPEDLSQVATDALAAELELALGALDSELSSYQFPEPRPSPTMTAGTGRPAAFEVLEASAVGQRLDLESEAAPQPLPGAKPAAD